MRRATAAERRSFLAIVRKTRDCMHGTPAEQRRALEFLEALREYGGELDAMARAIEAYALLPPDRKRH